MQNNMQVDWTIDGGSEQDGSSCDGQVRVALRRMMMNKEFDLMVIRAVERAIVPVFGNLVRKIVKEEIQSVETRLFTGGTGKYADQSTMLEERSLQLKFLDEVSDPVLTGRLLKGKGDNFLMAALVDGATGQVVNCGPESSAKVEILVLDASGDDNEHNWTLEDFNKRIIREGDKEKPHFAKNIYIYLKNGVCVLDNAKLGHDAKWMKSCKCRLGARIVESFRGSYVQEARTESFLVSDSRSKLYEKHYPPSLSDKVWRLDHIGRDGAPRKRLEDEKVATVQDFLFMHSVNPQRLQQIVRGSAKNGCRIWDATMAHAQTCIIDDKKLYLHRPSESKMGVIFYAVGDLKGVVSESHYVPINDLSAEDKVCAHDLLRSAFENREERSSFDDEASLLQRFPYSSADINASTNSGSNGIGPNPTENVGGHYPTEPGTASQSITPYSQTSDQPNNIDHVGFFQSTDTREIYDPTLALDGYAPMDPGTSSQNISPSMRTFENMSNSPFPDYPESPTTRQFYEQIAGQCYPDFVFDSSIDNWSLMDANNSENLGAEPHPHQQSNARAYCLVRLLANAVLWGIRAKKRKRVAALEGDHVQKKAKNPAVSTATVDAI